MRRMRRSISRASPKGRKRLSRGRKGDADEHIETGPIADRVGGQPHAMPTAPTPGAPAGGRGPTAERQDVRAKTGMSATRPPSSTAKRSSEIGPQHDLLGLDVAETRGNRLPACGRRRGAPRGLRHGEDHQGAGSEEAEADRIGHGRAESVKEPTSPPGRRSSPSARRSSSRRLHWAGLPQAPDWAPATGKRAQKGPLYAEDDKNRVNRPR